MVENPPATSTPTAMEMHQGPTATTSNHTATPSPTARPTAPSLPTSTQIPDASLTPFGSTQIDPVPTRFPSPSPTRTVTTAPSATFTRTPGTAETVTPTPTSISQPTATRSPIPTPTPTPPPPTATPTLIPTPFSTSTPTPNPFNLIAFVDNDDCQGNINRELLPAKELTLTSGDSSFRVVAEIADDGNERQQGLMCRQTVPNGTGMLFVFQQAYPLNFWMFNTYAPLDIVYLNDTGAVVKALRMEPCPRPEGYDDTAWRSHCSGSAGGYGSGSDALYALELPGGWLESIGLEIDNLETLEVSW